MLELVRAASMRSHDDSKWIGCVIRAVDGTVIAEANRFPEGVDSTPPSRHSHDLGKADWMVHAERKACYKAARRGVALEGATMWVNWFPCGPCAQAVVDCGIREIVTLAPDFAHHRFGRSFLNADAILSEGGVIARRFACALGHSETSREPLVCRAA